MFHDMQLRGILLAEGDSQRGMDACHPEQAFFAQ
jgi:hypothetical protein